MSKATIFALPGVESENPIKEGDAVLIIRPGGALCSMTVGIDPAKVDEIQTKDPHDMTEDELDLALQGQTLFLLTMAAQNETIMDFLRQLAAMPGVTDLEKMKRAVTMH